MILEVHHVFIFCTNKTCHFVCRLFFNIWSASSVNTSIIALLASWVKFFSSSRPFSLWLKIGAYGIKGSGLLFFRAAKSLLKGLLKTTFWKASCNKDLFMSESSPAANFDKPQFLPPELLEEPLVEVQEVRQEQKLANAVPDAWERSSHGNFVSLSLHWRHQILYSHRARKWSKRRDYKYLNKPKIVWKITN